MSQPKQYRTTHAIPFEWQPIGGQTLHTGIIPAQVLCERLKTGAGRDYFVVSDLSWIADQSSMLYHDAYYRGISVEGRDLEQF